MRGSQRRGGFARLLILTPFEQLKSREFKAKLFERGYPEGDRGCVKKAA
jgi:hypothetical protein